MRTEDKQELTTEGNQDFTTKGNQELTNEGNQDFTTEENKDLSTEGHNKFLTINAQTTNADVQGKKSTTNNYFTIQSTAVSGISTKLLYDAYTASIQSSQSQFVNRGGVLSTTSPFVAGKSTTKYPMSSGDKFGTESSSSAKQPLTQNSMASE